MIEYVRYKNFRVLRNAILPLSGCTLILGPNGSGKSSAVAGLKLVMEQGIRAATHGAPWNSELLGQQGSIGRLPNGPIEIELSFQSKEKRFRVMVTNQTRTLYISENNRPDDVFKMTDIEGLDGVKIYSLQADAIANPIPLNPSTQIEESGSGLAAVLTQMQDQFPERFDALNAELREWHPEFDRILLETPSPGTRGFSLRTKAGQYKILAKDLSQGTLFSVCILTIAHLPSPPSLICLEEPDHGIHPRLLRQVHDAMMRLSNPSASGDQRKPVQVIATTHSPYFLELFRDHPEDVVLSEKGPDGGTFHRLTDMKNYDEIMHDAQLGDAWYSGVLGGVPTSP